MCDRDRIATHLGRAEAGPHERLITLVKTDRADDIEVAKSVLTIPYTPTSLPQKGVKHAPAAKGVLNDADRISLLTTIARSKAWIDELLLDPRADCRTIAERETLAERHVRFLAPPAYLERNWGAGRRKRSRRSGSIAPIGGIDLGRSNRHGSLLPDVIGHDRSDRWRTILRIGDLSR